MLRYRGLVGTALLAALAGAVAGCAQSDLQQELFAGTICPGGATDLGLDIAACQAANWPAVKAGGRDFAIIKATEGNGSSWYYVNPRFGGDWPGSKAAGVVRGAYHYFHPELSGTAQADFMLSIINKYGGLAKDDMPPMLDWEEPQCCGSPLPAGCGSASPSCGTPVSTMQANGMAFVNEIKAKTGRDTLIYTYPWVWTSVIGAPGWASSYPLDISSFNACPYVPGPWSGWKVWQYNTCASVSGVSGLCGSGCVDVDKFNGNYAQLVCWNLGPPPSPVPTGATQGLIFACGDSRRDTSLGDWDSGYYKAECSVSEAMTGLSRAPGLGYAHAALCNEDDATALPHATCHAVAFSAGDNRGTTATGDWDVGNYKGECATDEYVAGVSQSTDKLGVHAILCCTGNVTHSACTAEVFATKDARGSTASGEWDFGDYKSECATGDYVGGVSQEPGSGRPHAILCCSGIGAMPTNDAGAGGREAGGREAGRVVEGGAGSREAGSVSGDSGLPGSGSEAGAEPRAGTMAGGCGCAIGGRDPGGAPWAALALLVAVAGVALAARRRAARR